MMTRIWKLAMHALVIGSTLSVLAACERDRPHDPVPGPTDLSTTGNRVPPAATYGTGDSSERAGNLPGTADTGAMHGTTGFVTSGHMGLGGPGYTTGTTGVAGNQGIPSTMPNPNVGRTDVGENATSRAPRPCPDENRGDVPEDRPCAVTAQNINEQPSGARQKRAPTSVR